jgi:hypothetical protein
VHKVNTNDYDIEMGGNDFKIGRHHGSVQEEWSMHIKRELLRCKLVNLFLHVQQQTTLWIFFHVLVMAEDGLGFLLYVTYDRR